MRLRKPIKPLTAEDERKARPPKVRTRRSVNRSVAITRRECLLKQVAKLTLDLNIGSDARQRAVRAITNDGFGSLVSLW